MAVSGLDTGTRSHPGVAAVRLFDNGVRLQADDDETALPLLRTAAADSCALDLSGRDDGSRVVVGSLSPLPVWRVAHI